MTHKPLFVFDNSYARLPSAFFSPVQPAASPAPSWLHFNDDLAQSLGIEAARLHSPEGLAALSGSSSPEGAANLAMAYAGHQFGHFVPQLGDGRALLLGEILTPAGERIDLHFKGSGRTPFSRSGDGRAAVGPVVRELIMGEAMQALGMKTTRVLAAIATGETIARETAQQGALLLRGAASHIRVGTFEYFSARSEPDMLKILADYAISRHYPESAFHENPYLALLEAVMAAQASLVAHWIQLGFIHGVMNTDNMSIAGETIDYGPCAMMDTYDPATVYSSIDARGRYAFGNQPPIALWNLSSFARTLLPLLDEDPERAMTLAETALDRFPALYETNWLGGMKRKLGLLETQAGDKALIQNLLDIMNAGEADYTNCFRTLSALPGNWTAENETALVESFTHPGEITLWLAKWRERLTMEKHSPEAQSRGMQAANPAYIPRNHLVEEVLRAAEIGNLAPLSELLQVLRQPFQEQEGRARFALPPRPEQVVPQTFCGT